MVIDELDQAEAHRLARHYSDYRLRHELLRKQNSTDAKILSLLRHDNELAKQENANKNPIINSTMRDYLASEVSEDICRRYIFPEDVIKAHDEGIIHIHDMGYVSGPISNCELVNLEDMLQNGTVITDTLIEKPHSFSTACNIATQIIAQVASNTYGGQTISLSHLAPFVDVSRQKYKSEIKDEFLAIGREYTEDEVNRMAEMRVRKEVQRGIQTIQYQIQTLLIHMPKGKRQRIRRKKTMTNLEKNARTYRLPETTTPENLACSWSCTVNFGDKVLLAGYYYSGRNESSYFGAVYEYTTADHTCEGEIRLTAVSAEMFTDNGHALAWGMAQ